ncbi:hypothetical protein FKM82_009180 [Ascaphus truei]
MLYRLLVLSIVIHDTCFIAVLYNTLTADSSEGSQYIAIVESRNASLYGNFDKIPRSTFNCNISVYILHVSCKNLFVFCSFFHVHYCYRGFLFRNISPDVMLM